MNRLTGFLVFLVLVATVVVPPLESSFTISPWGGLTTLDMADVHKDLKARAELPGRTLVGLEEFVTEASTGAPYMVGLDLASFRFAYLMPTTAKVTWDTFGIQFSDEITTSFGMALIGIRVPHPTRAIMSIGIYGGYAYAMVDEVRSQEGVETPLREISAAGGDIAAEAIFAIQIWRLEINASYRYAMINKILTTKGVDLNDDDDYEDPGEIGEGKPLRDVKGDPLIYDYSGVMITVGLRFGPGPKESLESLFRDYGPWGYSQRERR